LSISTYSLPLLPAPTAACAAQTLHALTLR